MSQQMLNEDTWSSAEIQAAFPAEPERMSYGGVVAKVIGFLVVVLALGSVGWQLSDSLLGRGSGLLYLLGYLVLVALTVAAAGNPRLALPAGLLYCVLNGLWMGAISRYYDEVFGGIVAAALLGTIAVALAVVLLSASGAVRVTARGARIISALVLGVALLYLMGWFLSFFGIRLNLLYGATTAGVVFSSLVLVLAAATLLLDVDNVQRGVALGAPKSAEWYAAFGVVSSLVWIYLEVLRLLARLAVMNQR